jgi:hypothetical protein
MEVDHGLKAIFPPIMKASLEALHFARMPWRILALASARAKWLSFIYSRIYSSVVRLASVLRGGVLPGALFSAGPASGEVHSPILRTSYEGDEESRKPKPCLHGAEAYGGCATRSKRAVHRVGTDFLKVDLETALTFVQVALTTEDLATRERNRKSARGAYDTVLRFTKKLRLSESDVTELKRDLRRLKADLLRLGETF